MAQTIVGKVKSQRVAVNSGYLLAANLIESLLSIVLLGLVARYLDQAGFGRYGYVISFVELFIMLTELSSSRVLVREMASDLPNAPHALADSWSLRLLTSAGTLVLVAVVAGAQAADRQLWWAILLFAVGQVFFVLADIFTGIFRAHQQMQYQTMTVAASQTVTVLLCLGAILLHWGLVGLFLARAVGSLCRLTFAWALARRRFMGVRLSHDWDRIRYVLRESFPLGLNLLLRRLIWRGGIVMVTTTLNRVAPGQGELAAGLIYGPLRLVEQLRIVPNAMVGAILPVFALQARDAPERFRESLTKSGKLLMTLSLLLAVLISGLAAPLARLVLGSGLGQAAGVLAVFAWIILFTYPNLLVEAALLSIGRQALVTVGLGLGLAISLGAGWLYLVPRFEAFGVIYGIILAEGTAFAVGVGGLWAYLDRRRWLGVVAKLALTALAAMAIMTISQHLGFGWVGLLGLLTFVAATLTLRTFTADELEAIVTMLTVTRPLRWVRRWLFPGTPADR